MYLKLSLICMFSVTLISEGVTISNVNSTDNEAADVLLELSNVAIQGRQSGLYHQNYYQNPNRYPSYYQGYKPYKQQYGYPHDYTNTNEVFDANHKPYRDYPYFPSPQFVQNTRQSVMDALFSIAQNDDLQCVPKLLCDITAGGLTGRQALPINLNLDSLLLLVSGVDSANMSPVLHFGKAAFLGFASKGNTRKCDIAYPRCPSDPIRLVQYLNNHNGGFFRFFQGLNSQNPNYNQNYAQYFNKYRPGYFGKQNFAEKRIQTKPSEYVNSYSEPQDYYKTGKGFNFPYLAEPVPLKYPHSETKTVVFPDVEDNSAHSTPFLSETLKSKKLKFPELGSELTYNTENYNVRYPSNSYYSNEYPYRVGKKLKFNQESIQIGDNILDIQRPLPNHRPSPNIFPDRTGTGELKLDLVDLEKNYQDSLAYDENTYRDLLYDSFPNGRGGRQLNSLHFPRE
ncbi:uncharacterized protein LOC115882197 [Sitophilus oryzae]|uniref:Uncharacterized protein LOC115882197 n=1 Tax=Sitophilus oryzae TaxID=7048 RepID=A0A6J2XYW2_SITOR|nr:uncharacterized protein LOC115882197 [Sitophilus oryzae]